MTALAKFRALFLGDDEQAYVSGGGRAPVVPAWSVAAPGDPEQAARVEAERCKAVADDLQTRLDAAAAAIPGLEERRATLARSLAVDGDEGDFAQACAALDAGHARHEVLGQLLAEAEAARREAQGRLNEAERPRREAERRARVEAATAKAREASDRFCGLYRDASAALAGLGDDLDALAALSTDAAQVVGAGLASYEGDPMRRLTLGGWTVRPSSPFVAVEFRLIALAPPKGR